MVVSYPAMAARALLLATFHGAAAKYLANTKWCGGKIRAG